MLKEEGMLTNPSLRRHYPDQVLRVLSQLHLKGIQIRHPGKR